MVLPKKRRNKVYTVIAVFRQGRGDDMQQHDISISFLMSSLEEDVRMGLCKLTSNFVVCCPTRKFSWHLRNALCSRTTTCTRPTDRRSRTMSHGSTFENGVQPSFDAETLSFR